MSAYQAKQPVRRFLASPTANRATGTVNGTTMVLTRATQNMVAASAVLGRTVTRVVAASNASPAMLAQADYVCDGVADQVQINQALLDTPIWGGIVLLSEGTFTLSDIVDVGRGTTLCGMGMAATILAAVSSGGAAINRALVWLTADCASISDFTIDGNKANNASATSMQGVRVQGIAAPLVERIRVINSAGGGIAYLGAVANGIIRDCLVENSVYGGFYIWSSAGQPAVISGCTTKGCGGYGFGIEDGPAVFSDCQALSGVVNSTGYGFVCYATAVATFNNCTAQSNASYGFHVTAPDIVLVACRAESNVGRGFSIDGARASLQGCLASSTTGAGNYGFWNAAGATDALYTGCSAFDNAGTGGFYHNSSGVVTYVGCQAINQQYGWVIEIGEAHLRACYVYGQTGGGYGIFLIAGTNHSVDGCRVTNVAGHGIYTQPAATYTQVANNQVNASGLAAHNTYSQLAIAGDNNVVHGNLLRNPASGNRPAYGIVIAPESDGSFVGINDTYGSGFTQEVAELGTNTRRRVRLALDYTAAVDLLNGVTLTLLTWMDVLADQTFRVDSVRSVVEIAVRGCMLVGAGTPAYAGQTNLRLLIDGVTTKKLGGQGAETGYWQSPFAVQPIKVTGLTAGNHTVRLQVYTRGNTKTMYLRAAGAPQLEFLSIQVTEYAR